MFDPMSAVHTINLKERLGRIGTEDAKTAVEYISWLEARVLIMSQKIVELEEYKFMYESCSK